MKNLLFLLTHPPHGRIHAQEGLDALLMGSAFAVCNAVCLGDGLFQLLKDQQTHEAGLKDFSKTFGALQDYGVTSVMVCHEDMADRNVAAGDLVIDVTVIGRSDVAGLITNADQVLNF